MNCLRQGYGQLSYYKQTYIQTHSHIQTDAPKTVPRRLAGGNERADLVDVSLVGDRLKRDSAAVTYR